MRRLSDFGLARSDRWILSGSVVAVVLSSLLLWQDGWLRQWLGFTSKTGSPLGKITLAAQDVRRRTRTSLAWIPVETNEEVFENDSLFTGEESEAVVALDKVGELTLSPNSLVILRQSQKDLLLDLQLGRFRTQLTQGQALHVLQSGAVAVIEGKGSENVVNFHRDRQGKLSVAPLQGQVEVRLNDQGSLANPQQSLETSGRELKSKGVPMALRSPVGGRRLWVDLDGTVKFEWDVIKGSEHEHRIRISKTEGFKKDTLVDEVPSSTYSTRELKDEGVYFWQVEANVNGEWTPVSALGDFVLLRKSPPDLLYPYAGLNVVGPAPAMKLEFQWQEKRGVENYQMQVSQDAQFSQVLLEKESSAPRVAGVELQKGNYFWRVRALGSSPIANLWTGVAAFSVNRTGDEKAPVGVPLAEEFEDELKPEAEVAVEQTPTAPEVAEAQKEPLPKVDGKAMAPPAVPQILTDLESVTLQFPPSTERSPASLAQLVPTNAPRFQWKKVEGAETYEIELADSEDFSGKKTYLGSKSDLAIWRDVQPGQYYWRVRSRRGDLTSEFTPAKSLRVELPAPVVKASESLGGSSEDKTISHLWSWQPVPRATGYEVVTSDSDDFASSQNQKVKEAQLSVTVGPGPKFLKVAALGAGDRRVSGYSSVGTLKIVNQLKLGAPKVLRPENGLTIINFGSGSNPVAFGWRAVESAKVYRLQFSNSESFDEIVMEKELSENELVLSSDEFEGQIYWRLRSESGKTASAWSPTRHFKSEKK